MNIISKHKILSGIFAALIFLACQGPWDYWPENPGNYRGIWIYAHLVAGRPVSDVCLEKLLDLDETYMSSFAFFEKADITISGPFSGSNQTITLYQSSNPNCFDGSYILFDGSYPFLAEAGGTYKLEATVYWDSSGHFVTSRFTAETSIPQSFSIKHALAPEPAISGNAFSDRRSFVEYNKGASIYYMEPPNDILSHYFIPNYSSDVAGVLVNMAYDHNKVSWGQNTIDLLLPQLAADTGRKAQFGDQNRLDYVWNLEIAGMNNAIDSIAILNAYFPIGNDIKFLFYATGKDYADYIETDIYQGDDSRIKSKYNIKGGAGIFAGMLVDTFSVNIRMPEGGVIYNGEYARYVHCISKERDASEYNYDSKKECRLNFPQYCKDRYINGDNIDIGCFPIFVSWAFENVYSWNFYLRGFLIDSDDFAQILRDGEIFYCVNNNYDKYYSFCENEYKEAVESETRTSAMETLWTWCMDRDWPIHFRSYSECGSAMVSWARLENKKSNVLEREIKTWCADNPDNLQCKYRN